MTVPWKRRHFAGGCSAMDPPVLIASCDPSRKEHGARPRRGGEDLVVQNHIEQRSMYPDATVVFNKPEFAKAIHEEANAGPGGADHFCQSFLRDLRNQRFRFPRLAKLC